MTGKGHFTLKPSALWAACAAILGTLHQPIMANPQGGVVAAGQATISEPDPKTLHVQQSSDKAIIDWRSFNIAVDETTQFFQPSSSSWTLNRVAGSQDPSQILGTLRANGNIVIVNPDGILFGPNSRVDVNGLVATTHDIRNDDFMAGRMDFSIPGKASASIVNQGNISIADQGIGAFVAPGVRNQGVIAARFGKVSLAAANGFTLDFYGDDLVRLVVGDEIAREVVDVATGQPMAALVKNEGRINADGGIVALSAATARRAVNSVVNNTGVIEARSIGQRNGRISLGGQTAKTKSKDAPLQKVLVSGKLDVSGNNETEKGGKIEITGEGLLLADLGITARGHSGGGTVLIGGDYQGTGSTATATYTNIASDVTIDTDAIQEGDGGKVIVWADHASRVHGTINARGGLGKGNGGFIETSGMDFLDVEGIRINADAYNGVSGQWLLDPTADVYISSSSHSATTSGANPLIFELAATPTYIRSGTIESALNQGTSVTIKTHNGSDTGKGIIHLQDDIEKTAGADATLSLLANTGTYLNYGYHISSTSNKLNIVIDADADNINGGIVKVNSNSVSSPYVIQTNGGYVDIRTWDHVYEGRAINTSGGNVTLRHNNRDATWMTIARGYGSAFIVDAGTGNVTLDTKYSSPYVSNDMGDKIELGDYAVRSDQLTIEASAITNQGQGFTWSNSEYSYTTPVFDNNNSTGEVNYRTKDIHGGANFSDIDGRLISDEEYNQTRAEEDAKNRTLSQLDNMAAHLQSIQQYINLLFGSWMSPSPLPTIPQANPVANSQWQTLQSPAQLANVMNTGPGVSISSHAGTYGHPIGVLEPNGREVETWGWTEGGIVATGGKTKYEPIDSITLLIKGEIPKTLSAYPNMVKDKDGKDIEDPINGPFQCTALIANYVSLLGIDKTAIPNGKEVASSLSKNENFQYSKVDGSNVNQPQVGSIVSMETNDKEHGHVAIIKAITPNQDGSLTATLIEQNLHIKDTKGFAINRTIVFKKDGDAWKAENTINQDSKVKNPNSYPVVDWVTPKSLIKK